MTILCCASFLRACTAWWPVYRCSCGSLFCCPPGVWWCCLSWWLAAGTLEILQNWPIVWTNATGNQRFDFIIKLCLFFLTYLFLHFPWSQPHAASSAFLCLIVAVHHYESLTTLQSSPITLTSNSNLHFKKRSTLNPEPIRSIRNRINQRMNRRLRRRKTTTTAHTVATGERDIHVAGEILDVGIGWWVMSGFGFVSTSPALSREWLGDIHIHGVRKVMRHFHRERPRARESIDVPWEELVWVWSCWTADVGGAVGCGVCIVSAMFLYWTRLSKKAWWRHVEITKTVPVPFPLTQLSSQVVEVLELGSRNVTISSSALLLDQSGHWSRRGEGRTS